MKADAAEARLEPIADGLYRFDTGYVRPRHTASFVVVEGDRAAVIDCSVAAAVAPLVRAIESLGLGRDAVEAVITTHAHLDHTGGVGRLMDALPEARLYAHASTARHMIDPVRLEQGTRTVFGDEFFEREHEPLVAVPAERVVETPDGAIVPPGGRGLTVMHTPGHAWDHQCLWDPPTGSLIAGDAFGVGYPELDGPDGPFFVPETPPTQFDPDAMHASIDRIVERAPNRVLPSHFQVVEDPAAVANTLHAMVDESIARCLNAGSVEALEDSILDLYEQALERRGRADDAPAMRRLYTMDANLVAQGLWLWRCKREQRS